MKLSVAKRLNGLSLALLLCGPSVLSGATRNGELPDKEMLRIIEFLREMEMLKQMEMMRELNHAEALGEPVKSATPTKTTDARKKVSLK